MAKSTKVKGARKVVVPRPLTGRLDILNTEASKEVPRELRDIEIAPPEPFVVKTVDRTKITRVDLVAPSRPPWTATKSAPAIPKRSRFARVKHQGEELEPLHIFPPEDRITYNDRSYPWGTVCRVLSAGSGVIVGPRHVLTASHVIDWNNVGGTVDVHPHGGVAAARTSIEFVWYYQQVVGPIDWIENDDDYAVLVTKQRIGDRFGWMGTRTYLREWDRERYWHNFGYPIDKPGPIWQADKWLIEDMWDLGEGRSMITDADMEQGQSGGPLFGFWKDGPYVVAVVSAHSKKKDDSCDQNLVNRCSGGNAMTSLVAQARKEHP